jgi:phosphoglycolate phosphatase
MNDQPSAPADLDSILTRARFLLFDFDGTICSLFAGTPTEPIADQLRAVIATDTEPPVTRDWFEILAYAHSVSPELGARVADELTKIETAAVPIARQSAYAHDAIAACRESGRGVAIISNNSEQAVRSYLEMHDLGRQVAIVAARTDSDPAKLKPRPFLMRQAVEALGAVTTDCVMIGDMVTDIQAARAVGAQVIGYAPAASNAKRLGESGARAVISTMADLALRLRARPINLS